MRGRPAGPSSLLVAGVAAAMLAVTFSVRAAPRHPVTGHNSAPATLAGKRITMNDAG